jgi:hypothetical protein
MRVRQRSDAIWYHRKLAWVSDMLLYLLTGYGKRPSNSVYIAIALVGIGMWIFPPKHMKPQDDTKKAPPYSRFWYSLDLLAPVIDLGVASVWEPKQSWWFGRNYAQLQRIAGWILLPLILAAITGLIQ